MVSTSGIKAWPLRSKEALCRKVSVGLYFASSSVDVSNRRRDPGPLPSLIALGDDSPFLFVFLISMRIEWRFTATVQAVQYVRGGFGPDFRSASVSVFVYIDQGRVAGKYEGGRGVRNAVVLQHVLDFICV